MKQNNNSSPKDIFIVVLFFILIIGAFFAFKSAHNYLSTYKNVIYKDKPYTLDNVKHEPIKNLPQNRVNGISDKLARDLKSMYVSFRNITDKKNIKHWVAGGTLIGAIRHKGFIPWDDDMDIHMEIKDIDLLLDPSFQRELDQHGLKLTYSPLAGEATSAFRIMKKGSTTLTPPFIDILFEHPLDDKRLSRCREITNINKLGSRKRCLETIPRETWNRDDVYPLKKIKFEDIWVYIPNNPEILLKIQYGDNVLEKLVLPDIYHANVGWMLPAVGVNNNKTNNNIKTIKHIKDSFQFSNSNIFSGSKWHQ